MIYYSDGSKYDGSFKNNQHHGFGTKTYSNNQQQRGNWDNGIFVGEAIPKFNNTHVQHYHQRMFSSSYFYGTQATTQHMNRT